MDFTISSPLPPLRYDLAGYEVAPGVVVLYDELGYAEKSITLATEIIRTLMLLDGQKTAQEIAALVAAAGHPFDAEDFVGVVAALEREHFLDSPRYRDHRSGVDQAFNALTVRPTAHAGGSYPSDPEKLKAFLDELLKNGVTDVDSESPVAVFAPHIDFRVGGASYGPAYNALRHSDADTFIVLGVPHKMSYDRFMISRKDFDTPLGPVPTDREFIDHFRERLSFELSEDEIAHKEEHSIEFQVVFLRHIFPERDIRIVPILAGSLYDYVESGRGGAAEDEALTELYETLETTARDLGRNVCYVAGVDLCHVGKKFGDDFAARSVLGKIREHDMALLAEAVRPDAEGFLTHLARIRNCYKVCGVSPMYATLRAAKPARGKLLCYDQWDETDRESAVSFASVAFYR